MGWERTAVIAFALLLVMSLPAATAQGQSLFVTTSKAFYGEGERVMVAGTTADSEDRRPVLVKVTRGEDECARQTIRPQHDGSFISRPMDITGCGSGYFTVTATHASATSSASFAIEGKQDVMDSFELRAIKSTVTRAHDVVNARVREVLDANLAIPERAAESYSKGVAETSLTLQGVDRGDVQSAAEHRDKALVHFREVLDLLSPEKVGNLMEDVREQDTRFTATNEWLGRLQDLFNNLVELAEKNDIVADKEFGQIDGFLSDARQLVSERNTDSATELLQSADHLLEEARIKLIQQAEGNDSQIQALVSAADRLENSGHELRGKAEDIPWALAKVNASFVLINGARSSIQDGDYEAAKASLDSALKKLEEAREIIKERG